MQISYAVSFGWWRKIKLINGNECYNLFPFFFSFTECYIELRNWKN